MGNHPFFIYLSTQTYHACLLLRSSMQYHAHLLKMLLYLLIKM